MSIFKKLFFIFLIMITEQSNAACNALQLALGTCTLPGYTLTITNQALTTKNSFVDLGTVDVRGCSSPGLIALIGIREGVQNATCIETRAGSNLTITLIIPFKIALTNAQMTMKMAMDVPANVNNFPNIKFYKTRNQLIGGTEDMIAIDQVMANNSTINGELELTIPIIGSNAKSTYESYVVFIIGRNI